MSKFSPIETTLYKSFGPEDYEIDIRIEDAGFDGIGAFEFWGRPCFDKGRYGVSDFTILSLRDEEGAPVKDPEPIIQAMYDTDFSLELRDDLDIWLSEREDEEGRVSDED
jgi:hypothetical protein